MSESEQRRKTAALLVLWSRLFFWRAGREHFLSPFTTPRRSFWGPNPLELSSMDGLRELHQQLELLSISLAGTAGTVQALNPGRLSPFKGLIANAVWHRDSH